MSLINSCVTVRSPAQVVRISTAEEPVVVAVEESYREVGANRRRREHVIEGRAADTEQPGR